MKIKIQQFLYQNHSWSVVGWNIARALIKQGHVVHLIPTDRFITNDKGIETTEPRNCHLPEDLKPYELNSPDSIYDCQISYTAPINWGKYLRNGRKNRFAIWAYEFNGPNILPPGFSKYYQFADKILPPSNYVKDIFANSNIPENKMVVIPHGISLEDYENKNKLKLNTKNKIKIGLPLGQLHRRKNPKDLLEAYYKAFDKNDDVCLLLKMQHQKQQQKKKLNQFDVDFNTIYNELNRKYKNRGQVEIITKFIPNMIEFYNTCDIIFTMSNCEGFYMPGLEALAAGKIVIAPRHGGQLDFLNDDNSILIDGSIVRAPRSYAYWSSSPYANMFKPNIDDAVEKLRNTVENYEELQQKLSPNMKSQAESMTWDKVAEQILGLCE